MYTVARTVTRFYEYINGDECTCDDCDDAIYCQEYGCPTPPMGWAIIYQPAE